MFNRNYCESAFKLMDYPFINIIPRPTKMNATIVIATPSFLVFSFSEYCSKYEPFKNKKILPSIMIIPNIFVSISKLTEILKFLRTIFLKVKFQILREIGSPYTHNRLSPLHPPNHFYRREIPCFMFADVVNYGVEILRAMTTALCRFCVSIRNYGGSGVSNPLTLLSKCDTPICFKVEILGG